MNIRITLIIELKNRFYTRLLGIFPLLLQIALLGTVGNCSGQFAVRNLRRRDPPGTAHCQLPTAHPPNYFFFPAIAFAGPLRVRALVCVRWPRTGSERR